MDKRNGITFSSRRDALLALTAAVVPAGVLSNPVRAVARTAATLAAAAQSSAKLAAEHFEPLVGQTFRLGENPVTLRKVSRMRNTGSPFREQFSIAFEASPDVALPGEPVPVSHPAVGRHNLLVTQTGNAANGTALEICFA